MYASTPLHVSEHYIHVHKIRRFRHGGSFLSDYFVRAALRAQNQVEQASQAQTEQDGL